MLDFVSGYPVDNRDAWAQEVVYSYHWFRTAVHFHVRLCCIGKNKFPFRERAATWTREHHFGTLKRILDVGTCQYFSAAAYERVYPIEGHRRVLASSQVL